MRFRIRLDTALVETLHDKQLPQDFSPRTPYAVTQTIGDDWLQRGRTPVLSVPSAIVPVERNFILNPEHPRFERLIWNASESMSPDDRLWMMGA